MGKFTIVIYIQSKYDEQSLNKSTDEKLRVAYSKDFLNYTKGLLKNESSDTPPLNKNIETQRPATKNIIASEDTFRPEVPQKSLVLVFGFSYFASIDNINGKSNFDDNDIDWLINGVEWYWFGSDFEEIPSDPKGNVCLLKIDVTSNDPVIPGKIQLKNFLNGIKNKKIPLHQIKSNPGERYQLASFKDKGFRQ